MAKGAQVHRIDGNNIHLVDDDKQDHYTRAGTRLKPMHPSSVEGVEDMILLGDLNEAGILRNLFCRYYKELIYVSFFFFSYFICRLCFFEVFVMKMLCFYFIFFF